MTTSRERATEGLALRPMTLEEFEEFRARAIVSYAAAHVAAGNWEESFAQVFAARDIDALLPAGPDTPAMLLFSAVLGHGAVVGVLWLALDRGLPGRAWIYEIEVVEGARGRGYGAALLAAAESEALRHGATSMGLNVFGANLVARHLYERAGYQVTTLQMQKALTEPG